MQPAPMIYMYEVNLDLAVTAILKQISTQRRGDACVQKCVEKNRAAPCSVLRAPSLLQLSSVTYAAGTS